MGFLAGLAGGLFGHPGRRTAIGGFASGLTGAMGVVGGGRGYRRRRRKVLSQSAITELTMIKNILGRTAAANALPFFLGRR